MKCFEVTINGVKVCTAGIGDAGVLTSILSFVKQNTDTETLELRVGGLANRETGMTEQLEWLIQTLAVGDEVTIKIVEARECDEPISTEATVSGACSFCSKKQADVEKLIAGPAVFICNQCVADCSAGLTMGEPIGSITMIIREDAEARCSFCGKAPEEVAGMAGVPTAHICNECIKICGDILTGDE